MENKNKRDLERAVRIKRTAERVGVSKRYVRMVLACERENEEVLAVFMELSEQENLMLEAVEKLFTFN